MEGNSNTATIVTAAATAAVVVAVAAAAAAMALGRDSSKGASCSGCGSNCECGKKGAAAASSKTCACGDCQCGNSCKCGETAAKFKERSKMEKAAVLAKRREFSSNTQSVTYGDPLMIVKGDREFLIDEKGVRYLDTRNNVGHVGWQHPRWHQAVCDQLALTNTNTRYLHPLMVQLAERLLAKFPKHLSQGGKVFFCNSGSEANELALRLAKTYTRKQGVLVLDHAYHGWTSSAVGISPYKKYGILDAKPRVYCGPCPDIYAGEYRVYPGGPLTEEAAGELYAKKIEEVCKEMGNNVECLIMESGMGVGGVILPPKGFMKKAFEAVRAAGGVCICDEVQTGFGRIGSHFWAFEANDADVCPDIVTMGKPFGNGFPIGAVVCTGEINKAFEDLNMELFSTFGGNPAACAAGMAVMDIIEDEKLQQNALKVGEVMKRLAQSVQERLKNDPKSKTIIGDVRGRGLLLGIELVRKNHLESGKPVAPEEVPEAADPETSKIQDRLLRVHRIITNVDGPRHNVFVVKPPICFNEQDAEYFMKSLEESIMYVSAN